jgi:ergothioneine biosynthesis protein EgtB
MTAEADLELRSGAAAEASHGLYEQFVRVREQTVELCRPLTPEDMMIQSCAEASPAKWHLAHTTWFFETFILREFLEGYRPEHPEYLWLFNSYYNAVGEQPEKKLRSSFSRPSLDSVLEYRSTVEDAIARLSAAGMPQEAARRLDLGIHHEQQHQELLCYDIKHAFWTNPLHPVYLPGSAGATASSAPRLRWVPYDGKLGEIGHGGGEFCYDNELPRHLEYVEAFALASRLVSCEEYLAFMEDGGYRRPELWLAEGWDTLKAQAWQAPLYWRCMDGDWSIFTLRGVFSLKEMKDTPVCHVSFFEADAYARWAGKRLPRESEWETASATLSPEGNLLENGRLHPAAARGVAGMEQMFGDVWEWTASPYVGYPGYRPPPGALGEYNGKFMCNQMVLRGGSAVTPASHIRASYRNFFAPATRWHFAGIRLADREA